MAVQTIGDSVRQSPYTEKAKSVFENLVKESIFLVPWSPRITTYFRNHGVTRIVELTKKPLNQFLSEQNITNEEVDEVCHKLRLFLRSTEALETDSPIEAEHFLADVDLLKIVVDSVLDGLPERRKVIITKRFGLWDGIRRSLEEIGEKLRLTRERVRQIANNAIKDLNTLPRRAMVVKSIDKLNEEILNPYLLNHWGVASGMELLDLVVELKGSSTVNELACTFISRVFFRSNYFFTACLKDCGDDIYSLNNTVKVGYKQVTHHASSYLKLNTIPQALESIVRYIQEADSSLGTVEPAFVRRCLRLCQNIREDSEGNFIHR